MYWIARDCVQHFILHPVIGPYVFQKERTWPENGPRQVPTPSFEGPGGMAWCVSGIIAVAWRRLHSMVRGLVGSQWGMSSRQDRLIYYVVWIRRVSCVLGQSFPVVASAVVFFNCIACIVPDSSNPSCH